MGKPYRVMCLETCEINGKKFYAGVAYTATFPLEGQTYFIPEGSPYPHQIDGVNIWGNDAMKFEPFMEAVDFEPKKDTTVTVKLNIDTNDKERMESIRNIGFFNPALNLYNPSLMNTPLRDLAEMEDNTPTVEETEGALRRLEELTGKKIDRKQWFKGGRWA